MIVLDSTPPALSLGRLVTRGYDFRWEGIRDGGGKTQPILTSPVGGNIRLVVHHDFPYIPNIAEELLAMVASLLTDRYHPLPLNTEAVLYTQNEDRGQIILNPVESNIDDDTNDLLDPMDSLVQHSEGTEPEEDVFVYEEEEDVPDFELQPGLFP